VGRFNVLRIVGWQTVLSSVVRHTVLRSGTVHPAE